MSTSQQVVTDADGRRGAIHRRPPAAALSARYDARPGASPASGIPRATEHQTRPGGTLWRSAARCRLDRCRRRGRDGTRLGTTPRGNHQLGLRRLRRLRRGHTGDNASTSAPESCDGYVADTHFGTEDKCRSRGREPSHIARAYLRGTCPRGAVEGCSPGVPPNDGRAQVASTSTEQMMPGAAASRRSAVISGQSRRSASAT